MSQVNEYLEEIESLRIRNEELEDDVKNYRFYMKKYFDQAVELQEAELIITKCLEVICSKCDKKSCKGCEWAKLIG